MPPPPPFFPYDGNGRSPNFPRCGDCDAGAGPDCQCRFWSNSGLQADAAMRAAARIGTVRYDCTNDEFHLTTPTTAATGGGNTGAGSGSESGGGGLNGGSSLSFTSHQTMKDGHDNILKRAPSFSEEDADEDNDDDDYDYDQQDDQAEFTTASEPPAKKLMMATPASSNRPSLLHPLPPRPRPPTPLPIAPWLSSSHSRNQNTPSTGWFWGNGTSSPFNSASNPNSNSNSNTSAFRLPPPFPSLGTPHPGRHSNPSYSAHPLYSAQIGELPPRPVAHHSSSYAYAPPWPQYQYQYQYQSQPRPRPYGGGSDQQTAAPTYAGSSSADLPRLLGAPPSYSYPPLPPPPPPPPPPRAAAAPPRHNYSSAPMSLEDIVQTRIDYERRRRYEAEENFWRYYGEEEEDADEEVEEEEEEQEPPPFSPLTDTNMDVEVEAEQPDSEEGEDTTKDEEGEEKEKEKDSEDQGNKVVDTDVIGSTHAPTTTPPDSTNTKAAAISPTAGTVAPPRITLLTSAPWASNNSTPAADEIRKIFWERYDSALTERKKQRDHHDLEEMFGTPCTCGYDLGSDALINSSWRNGEADGHKSAAAGADGSAGTRAPSEAGSDISAASSVTLGRDSDSWWRSSRPGAGLETFLRRSGSEAGKGNGNGNDNDTGYSLGRPSERRILTPRVPGHPRPSMWN